MIIIGIDPGYDRLGVAVIKKNDKKEILLFSDCIGSSKNYNFSERLFFIGDTLKKIISKWKPDTMAIETLYLQNNKKTGMRVSEARGVCIYFAGKYNLSIYEYTPIQIKETICGYGRADKKQVIDMVKRSILLTKKKRLDDEYDAIAIALTCIYRDINILSTLLKK